MKKIWDPSWTIKDLEAAGWIKLQNVRLEKGDVYATDRGSHRTCYWDVPGYQVADVGGFGHYWREPADKKPIYDCDKGLPATSNLKPGPKPEKRVLRRETVGVDLGDWD